MHFLVVLLLFLHFGTQISRSILTRNGLSILSGSFYTRKNATIGEKECLCVRNDECSCCEKVHIFDADTRKNMCLTFFYDENGLGVNISLDSNLIKSATINNLQINKICVTIPQDLFSKTCAELDRVTFSSTHSTVCSKLNFLSKYEKLQTKFDCVNVTRRSRITKEQIKTGPQIHMPIVKIKFSKFPYNFADVSDLNSNSSVLQLTPSPITQISIEITPSEISTAISTSEESLSDQLFSNQSPVTQTVPAPITSTVKSEENKPKLTTKPSIIKPVNKKPSQQPSTNVTETKQNVTLKHHIKVIGLSDTSTIKEIVRIPESTTPSEQPFVISTSVDQGTSSTTDKSKDKPKPNKRKIRFPDGRTVRRSRSNFKSAKIVNPQPREELTVNKAEKLQTTSSSATRKNMKFLEHPLVLPEFALAGPTVNVFFPVSAPPDFTTPFQFERFPSRNPPFIQHSHRDVEELETPIPPHDYYPFNKFNKLITISQKKLETNKSEETFV